MPASLQTVSVLISFLLAFVVCGVITIIPDFLPDIPNARSSHDRTVPRGGGISFMLAFVLCLAGFSILSGIIQDRTIQAFLIGSLLISMLGLLDDAFALSAITRLSLQTIIGLAVCFYGLPERLRLPAGVEVTGWPVVFLQLFWILACINFFNFMDGLDGLASVQALFVSIGLGFLFYFKSASPDSLFHSIVFFKVVGVSFFCLAASIFGFLLWNFPPARLFMGDTGSCFLGFVFAFAGLLSPFTKAASVNLPSVRFTKLPLEMNVDLMVINVLLLPFLLDAALTIFLRLIRKQNLFKAHREHLYQILFMRGWSAWQIDLFYLTINLGSLPFLAYYWMEKGSFQGFLVISLFALFLLLVYVMMRTNSRGQNS